VRIVAGPRDDVLLTADAQRLQQVFWNLLSNAVKFTPRDGEVLVTAAREQSRATVRVKDSGVGIPPEFLPHVFERFRQFDSSTRRAITGLGLGLAIVRHLTELHGGTVSASSDGHGKGAVFTVALPIAAVQRLPVDDARAGVRRSQASAPQSLNGIRVLVIDDEDDARELLSRVLRDRGAEVVTAGSAAEAIDCVERTRPHVILSDIGMAGTDGYDLIQMIRSLPPDAGGRVPAIAVTAYSRAEDRLNALTAGFQQHVAKPVVAAELIAMVASLAGTAGRTAV
jgi:CheY-like chemotaxis protein/anti-sigma regulatory factor (Ser/Thr protein kinase)